MGRDEILILEYLKRFPHTFTDASRIFQNACPQLRFAVEPKWAVPALSRLQDEGLLEINEFGQYRIRPALLAKYTEFSRGGERLDRGYEAVAERIVTMAPEDDEKPFSALIREALLSNYATDAGLTSEDQ